jgi:hypothetical protein
MGIKDEFKESIPGCFGATDLIFAGHALDAKRAQKMLIEAFKQEKCFSEVMNKIESFLKNKKSYANKMHSRTYQGTN